MSTETVYPNHRIVQRAAVSLRLKRELVYETVFPAVCHCSHYSFLVRKYTLYHTAASLLFTPAYPRLLLTTTSVSTRLQSHFQRRSLR